MSIKEKDDDRKKAKEITGNKDVLLDEHGNVIYVSPLSMPVDPTGYPANYDSSTEYPTDDYSSTGYATDDYY